MTSLLTPDNLVAHRGWQQHYPENTLLAVDEAIKIGAKHVEIDVQFSADGKAMVFHDPNLMRKCNDSRDIHTLTLLELKKLTVSAAARLGSDQHNTVISSLAELAAHLLTHPDVTLYVEIKEEILSYFSTEQILAELDQSLALIRSQVILISFNYPILHEALELGWRVGPVLKYWDDLFDNSPLPKESSCIFMDHLLVPENASLHTIPFQCVLYEIDTPESAQAWLERGAAKIETFRIGELLATQNQGTAE